MGPANPVPNATVLAWQASLNLPACAAPTNPGAPGPPPLNPATLAVQFWATIPLPRPHPDVPPGWALCGKPAYLVTNGTVGPETWRRATPLGPLTITATGAYRVNWGDPAAPGWQGPYPFEGEPWPNGSISHVYDNVGTVTITLEELWTATWRLGPLTGRLDALHTTTTIAGYPVRQLQAVITG